jgi:hypothetical protein
MEKEIKRQANTIARSFGYGWATEIVIDKTLPPGTGKVIDRTDYGYRKWTTGEYVPNAYRAKFGWKNTYYQAAKTVVALNPEKP